MSFLRSHAAPEAEHRNRSSMHTHTQI